MIEPYLIAIVIWHAYYTGQPPQMVLKKPFFGIFNLTSFSTYNCSTTDAELKSIEKCFNGSTLEIESPKKNIDIFFGQNVDILFQSEKCHKHNFH